MNDGAVDCYHDCNFSTVRSSILRYVMISIVATVMEESCGRSENRGRVGSSYEQQRSQARYHAPDQPLQVKASAHGSEPQSRRRSATIKCCAVDAMRWLAADMGIPAEGGEAIERKCRRCQPLLGLGSCEITNGAFVLKLEGGKCMFGLPMNNVSCFRIMTTRCGAGRLSDGKRR